MFHDNLQHNENHEPHIGLILSFFQLFKKLQDELNDVPDRLLTYYYEQILGQSRRKQIPDSVYCYVEIDPEVPELVLPESTRIIAGQNVDGQDILYEITDSVKMVNGIYSRQINPSERFRPFLALGEEQRFLSEDSKTMEEVDIGFAVSSPTLKLKGGNRKVDLSFLGPSFPEFSAYQEEIHQDGMGISQPTLKVRIKNQTVFHPYSFLQFLELEQLKISVEVKQLKNLSLYSNYGPMDQSIPFDLFGPTPKAGSYLMIGNDEIFAKDLDELNVGWTYYGLPAGEDMESYFGGYPYGIRNDSFKVKFQALSDFRFCPLT
ncbi:hypothetical protein GHT06_004989 [Daphnia sinensis]|uniref:Uncharacterized protein n=1 Tax=Daphnia sinensis TaxID=1820382 RepID=A0AAD5PNY8_9CRUS|nr:hypothetical protein GHT06_004989 [Daphnia sinensis]